MTQFKFYGKAKSDANDPKIAHVYFGSMSIDGFDFSEGIDGLRNHAAAMDTRGLDVIVVTDTGFAYHIV